MKKNLIYLFILLVSLSCDQKKENSNESYDLVILNGRVMDPETQFDDIANVGIKDGRIVAITKEPLTGTETVDATGKIVAPGFIDTHFHFQTPIGYSLGLRDGLTSSMDFEMGCAGSYIDGWYKARAGVTQANYGIAVSHEFARAMFIDGSDGADYLIRWSHSRLHNPCKNGLEPNTSNPRAGQRNSPRN